MNSELVKKALEKVANPGVLVNLISRRVRQLNTGYGGASRPMVADIGNLGVADIALRGQSSPVRQPIVGDDVKRL
jgi:hypothetical protein